MSFKITLLKRIRESIRNTKNIKEFELLRNNLPYSGVTYDTNHFETRYIAYEGIFTERTITKEEYVIYREIFDLVALKSIRLTGELSDAYKFDITDLEDDE